MKKIFVILVLPILLTYCGTTTEPNQNLDIPVNLTASCNYVEEILLRWNYDNGTVDDYIIQRKPENGDYSIIGITETDDTRFVDTQVDAGTTYFYQVAGRINETAGEWSSEISVFVKNGYPSLNFGSETTLEVVTWNIEHFPKNTDTTVEYVAEVIRGLDADIFALQEIESNTNFESLISILNIDDTINTWDGYRASTASYSINLAYIYKSNAVQVSDVYEIFESGYNRPFPRHPLVMGVNWNANSLYIINNHLKASGDGVLELEDEWDEETRRYEACNLLDDYITENLPNENVVILGDMNDVLTDSNENNVFITFLTNVEEYDFADLEIAQGPSLYWSYPTWPSHLDHMLLTNELFDEFDLEDSDIMTLLLDNILDGNWSEYDNNISDHRPVGLKLVFP
ncbi:MAG: endonuclease/exonuclease/phosphatase family protein [Candidatus Cloacimonetes bacterium]|nr:endonuclease/exonuclease/phosphatase family protein [Candidatus Cloacimonadota bacterium]